MAIALGSDWLPWLPFFWWMLLILVSLSIIIAIAGMAVDNWRLSKQHKGK